MGGEGGPCIVMEREEIYKLGDRENVSVLAQWARLLVRNIMVSWPSGCKQTTYKILMVNIQGGTEAKREQRQGH